MIMENKNDNENFEVPILKNKIPLTTNWDFVNFVFPSRYFSFY